MLSANTNSTDDTAGVRSSSSKKRSLRSGASRFSNRQLQQHQEKRNAIDDHFLEEIQQLDNTQDQLNIRVRERTSGTDMTEDRPRSRLGSLIFKNNAGNPAAASTSVSNALASSLEQKATELKGTLTRPLSSLFRRSHSHDRSAAASNPPSQQQQQEQQFAPNNNNIPLQASLNSSSNAHATKNRHTPTARGPLIGQKSDYGTSPATTSANRTQAFSGIANGNASASSAGGGLVMQTTTTTTRPFSGFPGKRSAATTALQQTSNEATSQSQPEIDLSEQAAIVPHVNVRRFSFSSNDPKTIFPTRIGQPQSSQQQNAMMRGNAGEIDVNFLSRFLCPDDEIHDEQVPWSWDSLFASVTSELREEWALEEEANNNGDLMGVGSNIAGEGMLIPNGLQQQQQQQHKSM